jgi:hypothetical protein
MLDFRQASERNETMVENWDEEEEELEAASSFKLPHYSLRTLMIVVTGAAVFFSLVAWWGFYLHSYRHRIKATRSCFS